jgi:hypothetical protein
VGLGAVVVLEAVVVLPVAAAVAMAGQEVQRLARLADRTAVTHLHLDILPERTQWEVALKAELATAELATARPAMARPAMGHLAATGSLAATKAIPAAKA